MHYSRRLATMSTAAEEEIISKEETPRGTCLTASPQNLIFTRSCAPTYLPFICPLFMTSNNFEQ